jgi:hypothetical protein
VPIYLLAEFTQSSNVLSYLTTGYYDGIIVNMDAILVRQSKFIFSDGSIAEIVIWEVPVPVLGSTHKFKYRLYYGKDGDKIIGFDNERGKGDHCHLDGKECPYLFTTTDALLNEFNKEVLKRRRK